MNENVSWTQVGVYHATFVYVDDSFSRLPTPLNTLLDVCLWMIVDVVLQVPTTCFAKKETGSIFILSKIPLDNR